MVERTKVSKMSSQNIEELFPRLKKAGYNITSPATVEYNCISWAASDTGALWWPDPQNIGYWPDGVPRTETLEAFLKAFETLGYIPCNTEKHEVDFEKIALYIDYNGKPTHAARQLSSGRWTSKLGRLEDIEHRLDDISGSLYGSVAVIMKRSK